jgi:serine/threonine protein kinase
VRWLSQAVVEHLRQVADCPDLTGTKYSLLEKIGQGGTGSVYRVRDLELQRDVALKVLHLPAPDAQASSRMVAEARIIARLEHPGVVPIHDAGVLPDGRLYYVMKLVRGKRLEQHAPAIHSVADLLSIFDKICQAVAFAHAQCVLHRDLKPQNIMVGAFGEVLVMDWGLAKVLRGNGTEACGEAIRGNSVPTFDQPSAGTPATQVGMVMGTPGYMAPEQARAEADRVDERTDVYALGAILAFLFTGPSRSGALPAPPPALRAIWQKALAEEPDQRYARVSDLAEDIARFVAQQPVHAYPEGVLRAAQRLLSKYRAAVMLVLAYLVMRILLLFLVGA